MSEPLSAPTVPTRPAHELSLSSVWRSPIVRSGPELLAALELSGLHRYELEYRVEAHTLNAIRDLQQQLGFSISSLHNFCPHPEIVPWENASGDCFSLASLDAAEHRQAVAYTKRTIETAAAMGARAVVLHLGRVDQSPDLSQFMKILDTDAMQTEWAKAFLAAHLGERRRLRQPHLDGVRAGLDELLPVAEAKRIKLGLENRYYLYQIPDFEETGLLLEEFDSPFIGYWHDIGHAQVRSYLQLPSHREYLAAFGRRLVGMHIHDCRGRQDHRAVGSGEVDFAMIAKYIPDEAIRVLELRSKVTVEEIHAGITRLREAEIL